jgi:hypothetical protein
MAMSAANIIFIVGLVVVIGGLVIWIATISARARRMSAVSDARLDAQLQNIADNPSIALSPPREAPTAQSASAAGSVKTKDERLAELAELHAKGSITDAELAAARAKILAE